MCKSLNATEHVVLHLKTEKSEGGKEKGRKDERQGKMEVVGRKISEEDNVSGRRCLNAGIEYVSTTVVVRKRKQNFVQESTRMFGAYLVIHTFIHLFVFMIIH